MQWRKIQRRAKGGNSGARAPSNLMSQLKHGIQPAASPSEYQEALSRAEGEPITGNLDADLQLVKAMLAKCSDVVYRAFTPGFPSAPRATLVYIDGMVDKKIIDQAVLSPLMLESRMAESALPQADTAVLIREFLLPLDELTEATTLGPMVSEVLRGKSALLLDGVPRAFVASTQGWKSRGVTEPVTEGLVRGPRDGFTENLRTNTALLRLRFPTPALKLEEMKIGRFTRTKVVIAYVEGIVNPVIVQEARDRLSRIDIDGVLESGYLEEFIEDAPWSPFPQIETTERPDKTAGALLEGRVAIMTGNTPFVLLVPTTLPQFLISTEDYYERFWFSTAIRWVRVLSFALALLLPSLYVAITTYQTELIPTGLLFSLAASREGVPFPGLVEALMMQVSLEILKEAGVRLPRPVGQSVSIVGGLVIGESAVRAGIASPAMVIVVSLTAIASFAIPGYHLMNGVRIIGFGLMLLAGTMGLPGVMWGVLAMLVHLASLRSFGIPYLAPVAPMNFSDLKDVAIRVPWWAMLRRPRLTGDQARGRQPEGQAPRPPQAKEGGSHGKGQN